MSAVDIKRKQVDLIRIQASRAESELKICERQDDIKRLEDVITKQKEREAEIEAEIKGLQQKDEG